MNRKRLMMYFDWLLGSFCIAIASVMFYQPVGLVVGGFTGFGIILYEISTQYFGFSIPLWVTNVTLNIPLLIIAYRIKGKEILLKSGIVVMMLTFAFYIMEMFTFEPMDMFISALAGAILDGIGLAFILKHNATSGGTDLVAVLLNKVKPEMPVSAVMFYINAFIIFLGLIVFGLESCLYAVAAAYTLSKVLDMYIVGVGSAKASLIVTDRHREITEEIYNTLGRGATIFEAKSIYTNNKKNVIYCVVNKKQIPILKQIVQKTDEKAFMTVLEVNEIVGLFN